MAPPVLQTLPSGVPFVELPRGGGTARIYGDPALQLAGTAPPVGAGEAVGSGALERTLGFEPQPGPLTPLSQGPAPAPASAPAPAPAPAPQDGTGSQPAPGGPPQPAPPAFMSVARPGYMQRGGWADTTEQTTRSDVDPAYIEAVQRADLDRARAAQAVGEAEMAVAPEVNAAQAAAADAAQIYHETQVDGARRARQEEIDRRLGDLDAQVAAYAKEPPPSEKEFWKGLGPGGAMGLIIGQALSTYGQMMAGQGPSDAVDRAIARSLQEQKMRLAEKGNRLQEAKGMLAEYMKRDMSKSEAEAAAEATYRSQLAQQLEVRLSQVRDPVQRAKLEQMAADNKGKLAEKWLKLQQDTAAKVTANRQYTPDRYVGGGTQDMVLVDGRYVPLATAKKLKDLGVWSPSGGQGDMPAFKSRDDVLRWASSGEPRTPEQLKHAQEYLKVFKDAPTEGSEREKIAKSNELRDLASTLKAQYKTGRSYGLTDADVLARRAAPIAYKGAEELRHAYGTIVGQAPGERGSKDIYMNNMAVAGQLWSRISNILTGAGMGENEAKKYAGQIGLEVDDKGINVVGVKNEYTFRQSLDRMERNAAKMVSELETEARRSKSPASAALDKAEGK